MATDYVAFAVVTEDELSCEYWRFYFLENTLWLDIYEYKDRLTKRHDFRTVRRYARLNRRDSMREEEVPLTEEIKKKAFDLFVSKLSVKLWSERR